MNTVPFVVIRRSNLLKAKMFLKILSVFYHTYKILYIYVYQFGLSGDFDISKKKNAHEYPLISIKIWIFITKGNSWRISRSKIEFDECQCRTTKIKMNIYICRVEHRRRPSFPSIIAPCKTRSFVLGELEHSFARRVI